MSKLSLLEIVLIIIASIYSIGWILNPDGKFEPIIAFCTILISGIDLWRRHSHQPRTQAPDQTQSKVECDTPSVVTDEEKLPPFKHANSCSFFEQRFSQAFPGIRKGQWFERSNAVERLKILLDSPLKFSVPNNGWITPIVWQSNGNNSIDDFRVIDKNTVIIDHQELRVKRIYAGFMPNYKQLFIYLEADKMPATGLYEHTQESLKEMQNYFGYAWEEYGIYKGQHLVTRAEYDDNAAIIMGKPVNLNGDCEIRVRYLTPYNMIISANSSSINQLSFDDKLKSYLNRILNGENCIDEFINDVKKLAPASDY